MEKILKCGLLKQRFSDRYCKVYDSDHKIKTIYYSDIKNVSIIEGGLIKKAKMVFLSESCNYVIQFDQKYYNDAKFVKMIIDNIPFETKEIKAQKASIIYQNTNIDDHPVVNHGLVKNTKFTDENIEAKVKNHNVSGLSNHQDNLNIDQAKVDINVNLINNTQSKILNDKNIETKVSTHKVAGISNYHDNIEEIGVFNEDFNLTKKQLINEDIIDERVYEYNFDYVDVNLVEEPDNEFDPNAIAVYANDLKIGYIKKGSISRIKKLMANNKIKTMDIEIYGGRYKIVYQNDEDDYELEKENDKVYGAKITIIEYI